ncbi:85/88 kDa calcium-independent phospholipase A2 isoform X2 [Bradysia coprophila]|uniref:85/88 kDa calcium-independent phospholipase A2 isoform X2 n=1 Tax=Bradysia coprophila TaxID=38358 RepID=UPI00187D9EF5|nr:85/88 kDa calcium-independent phospholipase A2 isoform X2 [Bradysia coprophila]
MAWLGFGALASGLVLQRLLGGETPPNKVQELKTESLESLQILHRDDGMVMYAPPLGSTEKKTIYEIVIHRPYTDNTNTSYSLYRAANQAEAEEKFYAFTQRLPVFLGIAKEMFTVSGLQKICDILSENPSWSIAHLVAFFNLTEHVTNPTVLELIDYPDHATFMTPLQLAIKCSHIEMVKILMPLCKMEHLDNDSNSIFHYASVTTKEMVNLLAAANVVNLNHCNSDGYTPLHRACLSDKPECVKSLIQAGADVNKAAGNINNVHRKTTTNNSVAELVEFNTNKLFIQDMKNGGTPLHWASSREVLLELVKRGCDINAVNFEERTALHVMVERNRLECVVALLSHEAEIDLRDKDGNTALHLAIQKKLVPIVQCLVVFGCDFNIQNRQGQTPRHMVGKDASGSNEDMILYILHSVGAKRCPESNKKCPPGCCFNGTYNGIPPAQPESPEQREQIYQVLASTSKNHLRGGLANFLQSGSIEAPTSPTNVEIVDVAPEQKGRSVMDSLMSMFQNKVVKAEPAKKESAPEVAEATVMETDSPRSSNSDKSDRDAPKLKGGRLLCMDGGGIRGLVLVQMLLEIEKLSQTPINHLFDWVAGTSTGGILALGLGSGKTMKQCMCMYLRMKDQAFVGSRPYASDNLETLLKESLGESTVMTDILHPKIMVTGVMADRKPVDLHLFRNYQCASDILGIVTPTSNRRVPPPRPEEQLIWRAARATGAAPSYFRAYGRFLDGGLIANNPTLDAMTEIHEYNMALRSVGREAEAIPVSAVISLGTGMIPVTELKEIDVFRPDSLFDAAKLAYGISAIGNLLVDQATASDGRVVDRARAWCSMIGVPYFRFNPQLSVDIAMDEKNDLKLINMLWEAKAYMHANRNKVIELINLLL